jgi:PKD repeat protein
MSIRAKIPARALVAALTAVVALIAGLAPQASAVVWHSKSGHFAGLAPRRGLNARTIPGAVGTSRRTHAATDSASAGASTTASVSSSAVNLDYHNGPVLHASSPYLVFWDPSGRIAPASRALLTRYLSDTAADSGRATNVWAVNRQFTDSTGFADYRQSFSASQAISDTQPFPGRDTSNCAAVAATYPNCVTDAQLQSELTRLIGSRSLPVGISGSAPVYIVLTPGDTNVCTASNDCASSTFCAYHSAFQSGGQSVVYAVIPMFFDGASQAQNPKACQADGNYAVQEPNGDIADVAVKALSHEFSETITDPTGSGWWNSSNGNEDGDNCNYYGGSANPASGSSPTAFGPVLGGSSAGSLYDQIIAGDHYYTQTEWSNGDSSCDAQPAAGAVRPAFTTSQSVIGLGGTVSFDPSASSSTQGYTSATWTFGDGSAPIFSAGSSGPAAVQHTFRSAGAYNITLTLVDMNGDLATVSHTVSVSNTPVAVFSPPASPAPGAPASFDGSASYDGGAPILTYAWDFGDGSRGLGVDVSHTYAAEGTYTVTLTITDALARTATVSHAVTVTTPPPPPPAASAPAATSTPPAAATNAPSATPAPPATLVTPALPTAVLRVATAHPLAGRGTSFNGTRSSDTGGQIVSYRWSFGDGASAGGATVSHAYRRAGAYRVTLTVADETGATARATTVVRVSAVATISRVAVRHGRHGTQLVLRVAAPGTLTVAGHRYRVRRAGTVSVTVSALAAARRARAAQAPAVKVTFTPAGASGATSVLTLAARDL